MKTERKNINRGFKRLNVWKDSVLLYVLAYKIFGNFPFELRKIAQIASMRLIAYQEIFRKVTAEEA
jgi:hypothetical protein